MNKEEIKKQIEELEDKLWLHNMIDHFTLEDIRIRDDLSNEISRLRSELREMEGDV